MVIIQRIQVEFRLWRLRHHPRSSPVRCRRRYPLLDLYEFVAFIIVRPWCERQASSGDGYVVGADRPDLLAEDENGQLWAKGRASLWFRFRLWNPRHFRAALNTRRLMLVNFMEWE